MKGLTTDKSIVAIAKGKDRIEAVNNAFSYLGGIGKFVKPGDKVLLKTNMMTAMGVPTITHIDTLKGLFQLCKDAGAKEVIVADKPVCGMPSRLHFEFSGYAKALERLGVKVVYFEEEEFVYSRDDNNYCLKDMHLPKSLVEADVWMTVPVAKTHEATITTLGIKNLHGIIPDEDKARHHRLRPECGSSLYEKFVDILNVSKPDLCVCDMFQAMEGQGPSFGQMIDKGICLVSEDVVACDAAVADIMGFKNLETPLVRIAHQRGLGVGDMNNIEIAGEDIADHRDCFTPANSDPEADIPEGLIVLRGDICKGGCQMPLRFVIDTMNIIIEKDLRDFGNVYILCGLYPPPPPEDKFVLVFGDCAIYSTWHYSYRQNPKKIGPWWKPRPAFIDVPGCCPLGLKWIVEFTRLVKGYASLITLAGIIEIYESDEYNFGCGVPPEKNPRRWNYDPQFASRYAEAIKESKPTKYLFSGESLKGKRREGEKK